MTHGDDNFITTITGRRFWPLDPRDEDIDVQDIAISLANLCRFNGHVRQFYSVAQHCVLVSLHVPHDTALYGLLHDAAEAYIGDMSGPLKHDDRMVHFREADWQLTRVIYRRFGLTHPEPSVVKHIDHLVIQDESRILTPNATRPPALRGPGLGIHFQPWQPEEARHRFIQRFYELHGVREDAIA